MNHMMSGIRWWRLATTGILLALRVALAACGGDDAPSTSRADASGSSGDASAAEVADAQKTIDSLFAGESFEEPPAEGPKPEAGKKVTVVVTGLAFAGSALFADAAKKAAELTGWDLTVYDGKFSPDRYQEGIRQAIADKADGILLYNVDCALAQSAMKQAKTAKIPMVATESIDCDKAGEGPSMFDAEVTYTSGDFTKLTDDLGRAQAAWVIAKTEGKAKVVEFKETDLQTAVLIQDGFEAEMKTCTGCEIVEQVEFVASDLGPKLQEKAQQALLKHPDANAVMAPYDDVIIAGIGAAIKSSGRKDDLNVVAGAGFEANMELVRNDEGQNAGYIVSIPWEGYAAADTLNRVFAGEEPVSSGIGVGFFDNDHNLGDSGPAESPIDFVAGYEKLWSGQG
jgi:ribose transport system substrate-binding protein